MKRLSWDAYFIKMAVLVSERATCDRLHVGAVIVKDNRVIATGYNGSPAGMPHCSDVGCDVVDGHCVATTHAEVNALLECAKYGISTNGATIYITFYPCYKCAKAIVQSGIKEIVYLNEYKNDIRVEKMFQALGITCREVRKC